MRSFNAIFIFLLVYIIAALTFWWFSLEKQSDTIAATDIEVLELKKTIHGPSPEYEQEMETILKREKSREKQYIGEGLTFLFITLAGAFIVYRSARKTLQLSEQQNNFMLAVTHELKTPLAGIKLGLQTMQKRQLDESTKKRLIESGVQEANRLNDLCSNILVASQLEGKQYKLVKEPVNFSEIVNECCDAFGQIIQVRMTRDIQPDLMIKGDSLSLQMAINNVLNNALKYSDLAPIEIQLKENNEEVLLIVKDAGTGIPDHEKKKVFEKFYRVGAENTRKKKGTGLGLYLTKKIIKQHNGKITLTDNEPQGTIVTISL